MEREQNMHDEIWCLLWMVMVFGAGNSRIWTILEQYDTPQKAYDALHHRDIIAELRLPEHTCRRIHQTTETHVNEMLERCRKLHISMIWYGDDAYPEQLMAIVNPPVLLFYQGDMTLLQNHLLLTVVGTRRATEYSLRIEKMLCDDLVKLGFVLVTGFAVGVDITANLCALHLRRPSIALMGCGLDVPYPAEHFQLKKEIAACGLILSEFLPGTSPAASNFPLRNRVLSGLSMGTLVIQAPLKSGALITAECALDQGRDVFCVPPADIFDKRYMGVIKYLRDGAIPVFDSRDIVYEYYTNFAHMIAASELYHENSRKTESLVMDFSDAQKSSRKKQKQPEAKQSEPSVSSEPDVNDPLFEADDAPMTELQRNILALLQKQRVMHIDILAAELDVPMGELATALTELELYGRAERMPGKQFRLIG